MKRTMMYLLLSAALLLSGSALASVEQGKDYVLLESALAAPAKPTAQIEVLDFFFYGCVHCYDLHLKLVEWEKTLPKDVLLTHVPVITRESMEAMAHTFYTLESLGQLHQLHDILYRAWHVDLLQLQDESSSVDFIATKGVDRANFSAAYDSTSIQNKVTHARQIARDYKVNDAPTLIVDGKYVIYGLQSDDTLRVLNEVIALARKARSQPATPAATVPAAPVPLIAPPVAPAAVSRQALPPTQQVMPAAPTRTDVLRSGQPDRRNCLELKTNAEIIKCANK